jgi:hygromycin-B 7''-O-kinase
LPERDLRRLPDGTNDVFAVGDTIVKLYPPRWAALAAPELAALGRFDGVLPVATPHVLASGVLEGWPYLVMSRLRGRALHDVWAGLDETEQRAITAEVGELVAVIHALPTSELPQLETDWPRLVRERSAACVARHREQHAPEPLVEQIPDFLARAAPLFPARFPLAIVTGDLHDYHLLVEPRSGGWRLSGLFDFDDARLGFAEYDLAATALFLCSGRPGLLHTLFEAYGVEELDETLGRRLLAYTLLHRYRELRWVLREYVRGEQPATLDELARAIYSF